MSVLQKSLFLALALTLSFCSSAASQDKSGATYRQKCAACHGPDGKAQTAAAKNLGVRSFASPEVTKMPDADLSAAIDKGKGKMPSYGKSMKPEEIKAMVAYVRSLGK
jgi:mono/diheme cytochrome c family protein